MVNVKKLRGKMVETGFSVESLAEVIGINRATLYRKLETGNFSIKEANIIATALHLTNEELNAIFFSQLKFSVFTNERGKDDKS